MPILNQLASGGYVPEYNLLGTMREASQTRMLQQQEQQYPEEVNWLRKKRGMEEEKFAQEKGTWAYEDKVRALGDIINDAPFTTYDNWDEIRAKGIAKDKTGSYAQLVPPKSYFDQLSAQSGGAEDARDLMDTFKAQKLPMAKAAHDKAMLELDKKKVGAQETTAAAHMIQALKEGKAEKETGDTSEFEKERPQWKGKRNTVEYQQAIMDWRKEKHQATTNIPSLSEEQLTSIAQGVEKHPTISKKDAQTILDSMYKRKLSLAEATRQFTNPSPFKTWSKDEKEYWFESKAKGGDSPRFGFGDRESYSEFAKEFATYQREKGVSGTEAVAVKAETKALSSSLATQEKIRGMMGGFVRNIDKQVDRVDDIMGKITSRVGVRAIDLPKRELLMRIKGSGNEAIISAYLIEISNEIGKLSTGSAASIRELSVDAQKQWQRIHDPNLSLKELKKILKETKEMGRMRIDSSEEEIKATRERLSKTEKALPKEQNKVGRFTIEEE